MRRSGESFIAHTLDIICSKWPNGCAGPKLLRAAGCRLRTFPDTTSTPTRRQKSQTENKRPETRRREFHVSRTAECHRLRQLWQGEVERSRESVAPQHK